MADYIEELHCLGAHPNLMKNEQHLIVRFVSRLRFSIKEKVKLQPFLTLSNTITYVESIDELLEFGFKKPIRSNPWDNSNGRRSLAMNNNSSLPQTTKG